LTLTTVINIHCTKTTLRFLTENSQTRAKETYLPAPHTWALQMINAAVPGWGTVSCGCISPPLEVFLIKHKENIVSTRI